MSNKLQVSDKDTIKYYDTETGYGILTDNSYFWYTFWWEDKENTHPDLENCMYIDIKTEKNGSQFIKFLDNYVKHTNFVMLEVSC